MSFEIHIRLTKIRNNNDTLHFILVQHAFRVQLVLLSIAQSRGKLIRLLLCLMSE